MLSRWINWSPSGLLLDSIWILDKKLAGLPPKKKCLNSTWTPGVDLKSTWNMWGSVKSSYHVGIESLFIIDHSSVLSQSYKTIPVSRVLTVHSDPLASESTLIQQGRDVSTFRVIMQYDLSESRMLHDYRRRSVLQGFSQVGGLWTFLTGVFAAIFGSTIIRILFGSIS